VLAGTGTAGAYQAGVLRALAALANGAHIARTTLPFDIVCGTSAGAINGAGLAAEAGDFTQATARLAALWSGLHAEHVYRTDIVGIGASGLRWMGALLLGWMFRRAPRSLLDNAPLGELLGRLHDGARLSDALSSGRLHALAITALSYTTGRHVTFYQSHRPIQPWRRSQRIAVATQIGVDHLLASSGIPFLFPATPLTIEGRQEYFGDGTMRQMSPLSPAIHLGASRVLVIGAASRQQPGWYDTVPGAGYPSLAQIGGQALASIFLDGLSADLERLQHVNSLLARAPELVDDLDGWRPVEVMAISPSERIEAIAARHVDRLPGSVRSLLRPLGGTEARGAAFASYLLFEPEFTQELIALGERDAMARREELETFLFGVPPPQPIHVVMPASSGA
jgi:NTE family protein